MRGDQIIDPRIAGGAGLTRALTTVTDAESPYTVTEFDELLWIDAGAAAVTVNLPAVANAFRRVLLFVVEDSTFTITLDPDGSEQIDGAATKAITAGLMIGCDASEWRTIASG